MHVPAYWPWLLGVQDQEYNGVVDEVKKTIAILSIPITSIEEEFMPSVPAMGMPVLIDILPLVVMAAIEDTLEVVDMSILIISVQG